MDTHTIIRRHGHTEGGFLGQRKLPEESCIRAESWARVELHPVTGNLEHELNRGDRVMFIV